MSLPVFLSLRAERDMALQYQWYLENAGEIVAGRYLAAVDLALQHLATNPELGLRRRSQSAELAGIRSLPARRPFDKHLIFYRAADNLSIERVMHGARNLPERLPGNPGD